MNEEIHAHWRETLRPPAGGLERLVDAIASQRPRGHGRQWMALASAAVILAAAASLHLHETAPQRRLRSALLAALRAAPADADLRVENGAALEIASDSADVRIFWIAQLPAADARADGG